MIIVFSIRSKGGYHLFIAGSVLVACDTAEPSQCSALSHLSLVNLTSQESLSIVQGCHGQGKVREKRKFFKVRESQGIF